MTSTALENPRAFFGQHAPWLLAPELGVCVVGSAALAEACRRGSIPPPHVADLDLSWALSVHDGAELLHGQGVALPTTSSNQERGTLALKIGGRRIEVTSFRSSCTGAIEERIAADLAARDMTVGALAWWLEHDRILDPLGGFEHWQERRIVPCGDVGHRVEEHPVRCIRYYRRAHQWGFALDSSIRRLRPGAQLLGRIPPEALGAEVRAALLDCASPGRLLLELYEVGVLAHVAPELASQFDGRPAGPVRHHPEVGQALHLIMSLEWIVEHTTHLPAADRLASAIAVLCHDLGKGLTDEEELPSHPGHETSGLPLVKQFLGRMPGLADGSARRLAEAVARLHLDIRRFDQLRAGTLVRFYDRYFRHADLRADLFALAVGADVGGRLGHSQEGERVAHKVEDDIKRLRQRCDTVDAGRLRREFADDMDGFKSALHQARCAALEKGRD